MNIAVPAILPSSYADLKEKLARFTELQSVERIQIDIVDGKFASPASWPYTAPREVRSMMDLGEMLPRPDRISYEIDLMCYDVERAAETWLTLGATRLTFHAESISDLPAFLAFAKKRYGPGSDFATGLVAFGIALNIGSDPSLIEPSLGEVAYVQFMGIKSIGKQGQPFDEQVLDKIKTFCALHPDIPVQVDGGVSLETAPKLIALGVSNLVVGSAITRSHDVSAALAAFNALENPFGV